MLYIEMNCAPVCCVCVRVVLPVQCVSMLISPMFRIQRRGRDEVILHVNNNIDTSTFLTAVRQFLPLSSYFACSMHDACAHIYCTTKTRCSLWGRIFAPPQTPTGSERIDVHVDGHLIVTRRAAPLSIIWLWTVIGFVSSVPKSCYRHAQRYASPMLIFSDQAFTCGTTTTAIQYFWFA